MVITVSEVSSYLFFILVDISKSFWSPVKSRDGAVGIATDYGLDDRGVGVRVPVRLRIFISSRPPIQWVLGALSPGVKRLGREADH
jgi:hypothetical protein